MKLRFQQLGGEVLAVWKGDQVLGYIKPGSYADFEFRFPRDWNGPRYLFDADNAQINAKICELTNKL
jgi:hypothetical protein